MPRKKELKPVRHSDLDRGKSQDEYREGILDALQTISAALVKIANSGAMKPKVKKG